MLPHIRVMNRMADNNPTGDFEKNIKFNLIVEGRDELGKFISKAEQLKGLKKVVQDFAKQQDKLRASIKKATAGATAALKRENKLLRSKDKIQGRLSKSQSDQIKIITRAAKQREAQIKRQLRLETKLNKTRERLTRQSRRGRGGAGGGLSLGRLGGAVAGLGLGFAAIRQIQSITDKRLETFLNLGAGATGRIGSLGGSGIAGVSKFAALNEFQAQGTSQFIQGQSEAIQAGLLRAQEDLSKLGTDVANKLLANISKSFGADVRRRREFFQTTSRQGIEPALQRFIGQFNFPEFSRAINALQQPDDPTLHLRGEFAKTVEALKDSFEKLVVTVGKDLIPIVEKLVPKLVSLLKTLSNLTTGDLVKGLVIGGGALIGGRLAAGAAIRGAGRLAGQGLTRGIPAIARGIGATGIGGAAALAAPIAIGGGVAIHETSKTREALTAALASTERQSGQLGRLDQLAQSLRLSATTDRERLTAQRLKLDRLISGIEPAGTERSLIFGRQLSGEFTPQQDRQLETLRKQRRKLQADIDALDNRREAEVKATQATKAETKALDKAAKSAEKFANNVKAPARDSLASRIERRQELELPKQLQDSISAIRREQLGTARISPFGGRLALDELKALNESLRQQQNNLREILSTFDEDDPRGQLEANKVRTQIAGIERELRANQVASQQAPLQIEQAETDLRRQEFQLRRLSPLGTVGAFPELQSINDSLRDQIEILNRMAASSELSALETINVKRAIISRELEIKQNQRAFLDAFRDQALQQVLQSGAGGRSIIISQTRNVATGLRKGLFGLPKDVSRALLGNVDPSVAPEMPKTASQILGFNPFERVDKLTPRNLEPVTMRGHKMIVESVDKLRKSLEPPKSNLDRVVDPSRTVGQSRQVAKPRAGATSADSMVNVGRFMVQVGEQMRVEQQDNDNRFSEPLTKYAGNRLLSVNPPG